MKKILIWDGENLNASFTSQTSLQYNKEIIMKIDVAIHFWGVLSFSKKILGSYMA